MTTEDRWQLPDGVEEVLPPQAACVERLRRQLLDLYRSWGYQLVIPPLIEYTESLLIGLGADIDLLTFKMTDRLSGRTLGVRADITPQVARIDAHSLAQQGVARLCYAGSVLHTSPKTPMASRSPLQIGVELYGDNSPAADVEVIRLMLETLDRAGLSELCLDLGHVGIYKAVLATAALSQEQERVVFEALQRKSVPDLRLALAGVEEQVAAMIIALVDLHGDDQVLSDARKLLHEKAPSALPAVDALEDVATIVRGLRPQLKVYFDLAELRGYHYHTGIVFAAYVPGHGQALANGGRYDGVGAVFGRTRSATGFATDLKALIAMMPVESTGPGAISVPISDDRLLQGRADELRAQGEIVINSLFGEVDPRCDRELVQEHDQWIVKSVKH
ncbi:MAG: ATP phosphoribosyltransferase regulatory subunit [Halieaceae bacterium]|jgi:ATP phosphoribosyltransferase regulatory subunit|nr:ATP phosphoribosyltransferase regulatory subunit [Halieaceae bacterium]